MSEGASLPSSHRGVVEPEFRPRSGWLLGHSVFRWVAEPGRVTWGPRAWGERLPRDGGEGVRERAPSDSRGLCSRRLFLRGPWPGATAVALGAQGVKRTLLSATRLGSESEGQKGRLKLHPFSPDSQESRAAWGPSLEERGRRALARGGGRGYS